jgi:hypothetical protein
MREAVRTSDIGRGGALSAWQVQVLLRASGEFFFFKPDRTPYSLCPRQGWQQATDLRGHGIGAGPGPVRGVGCGVWRGASADPRYLGPKDLMCGEAREPTWEYSSYVFELYRPVCPIESNTSTQLCELYCVCVILLVFVSATGAM